ncbi:hypothetical protein ATN38_24330 [Rhodococcus sp. FH8]|jgi:hypothetical protein|uniref:hypothetical protein n=1 Tax=Rhodococcus TaxID=1827 RepID=UPI001C4EB48F|nr:hypothetical protein [Rhodococcus sp. FH8]MBW0282847.1 hypothetical protein [Rhodococcus sp. FH8]
MFTESIAIRLDSDLPVSAALFGGYRMPLDIDNTQAQRPFSHKLFNVGRTEPQRADRASMTTD